MRPSSPEIIHQMGANFLIGRTVVPGCLSQRKRDRVMTQAEKYKERAAECVRMAERASSAEDKGMLLQMADTWLRLAEKAEDREAKPDR
jgi:hypothetical protein